MDLGLAGRTVLVTGGSSGVGLATVRALLDEGARVATCGRDPERLAKAAARLGAGPDRLFTGTCDVRDAAAVRHFTEAAAEQLRRRPRRTGQQRGPVPHEAPRRHEGRGLARRAGAEVRRSAQPLRPQPASYLRASDAAAVVNVNAVLAKQPETRLITTSAARAGILNLSKSLLRRTRRRGHPGQLRLPRPGRHRPVDPPPCGRGQRPDLRGVAGGARRRPGHRTGPPRPRRGGRVRDRHPALTARLLHHRNQHRRLRRSRPRHPLRSLPCVTTTGANSSSPTCGIPRHRHRLRHRVACTTCRSWRPSTADLRFVPVRHEATAVNAADAYGRARGFARLRPHLDRHRRGQRGGLADRGARVRDGRPARHRAGGVGVPGQRAGLHPRDQGPARHARARSPRTPLPSRPP